MNNSIIVFVSLMILVVSVNFVYADINEVTIEGRFVGLFTNEPIPDMTIKQKDKNGNSNEIARSDEDGKFKVTIDLQKLKQLGPYQQSYYATLMPIKECYIGPFISINALDSSPYIHTAVKNNDQLKIPIDKPVINIGDIHFNSKSDISIISDIESRMTYSLLYTSEYFTKIYGKKWLNFKKGNYHSKSHTLDPSLTDIIIVRLIDKEGNVFVSQPYQVSDKVCSKSTIEFQNKEFSSDMKIVSEANNIGHHDNYDTYEISVKKGWNLLPYSAIDPLPRSLIQPESIKGIYFYITLISDYIMIKNEEIGARDMFVHKLMSKLNISEVDYKNWIRKNINFFYNLGGWFYSNKDGIMTIVYRGEGVIAPFDYQKLAKGWNFIVIKGKKTKDRFR